MSIARVAKRAGCGLLAGLMVLGLGQSPGCTNDILTNLTRSTLGTISVGFVNNTPFRAILTYGTYNPENQFSTPDFQALRLEGNSISVIDEPKCDRRMAVATSALISQITKAGANVPDQEALHSAVFFSAAPLGDALEAAATEGIAAGRDQDLGVDFKCRSLLIYTFEVDPRFLGGFRIDYEVVP
jgi:hypothetical protein